jgi:hypothetical protein
MFVTEEVHPLEEPVTGKNRFLTTPRPAKGRIVTHPYPQETGLLARKDLLDLPNNIAFAAQLGCHVFSAPSKNRQKYRAPHRAVRIDANWRPTARKYSGAVSQGLSKKN